MFVDELRALSEDEEARTAGQSFGGHGPSAVFSVTKVRNWVLKNFPDAAEDLHDDVLGLGVALTPKDLLFPVSTNGTDLML